LKMKRQIVLLMLLMAALVYAVYSYWPLFSVYLPELGKAVPSETKLKKVEVVGPEEKPALVPKPAPAPGTEKTKEAVTATKKPSTEEEEKLIDPFALRISVLPKSALKTREEQQKEVIKVDEPKLEGIWVDSSMRVAFISGQALTEGGVVMGWRVKRITKTDVLLLKGSQQKTLRLEAILQ
jgi:hypothetical protein